MNILIDIGHPGHVHLFKNYFWKMREQGHDIVFTTRDKECTIELLEAYKLPYLNLGKPKKGAVKKVIGMYEFGRAIYRIAKKRKIDLFLSVSSMYAAQVAFLLGKKHIVLDDTEHSKFEHMLYRPFSSHLLNPLSFEKDFGKKQIKYAGFHELAYLHPRYFKANNSVLKDLGIKENEAFSIVRFVGWNAGHDISQKGLNIKQKSAIVKQIAKHNKVFITSEENVPQELQQYQISIAPHQMHDVLAYANLYIGEGATMASECAMLGTPAIYVNTLNAGTIKAQSDWGLIHNFRDYKGVKKCLENILRNPNSKKRYQINAQKMISECIDLTALLYQISLGDSGSKQEPINREKKLTLPELAIKR